MSTKVNVALFAPAIPPSPRGNARTIARISATLGTLGISSYPFETSTLPQQLNKFPDADNINLLHLFHLVHSYHALSNCWRELKLPYIFTQTGTDLSSNSPTGKDYCEFIAGAQFIACNHQGLRGELLSRYPMLEPSKVVVVRKSLQKLSSLEPLPPEIVSAFSAKIILLLPAHIRPVKGIAQALTAFESYLQTWPREQTEDLLLVVAGGVLDPDYFQQLKLSSQRQVLHITLKPEQMFAAYQRSSLVLNTSFVEGSPNAVLEALHFGRPVLGRDIPGITGIARLAEDELGPWSIDAANWPLQIFSSEDQLTLRIGELLADSVQLNLLGTRAKQAYRYLADEHREGREYLSLYCRAIELP